MFYCLKKIESEMNKNNLNQKSRHESKETAYHPVDDSRITIIRSGNVKEVYKNLDEALSQIASFEPIPSFNYEPEDRFSCCNWLSNLTLSSRIAL